MKVLLVNSCSNDIADTMKYSSHMPIYIDKIENLDSIGAIDISRYDAFVYVAKDNAYLEKLKDIAKVIGKDRVFVLYSSLESPCDGRYYGHCFDVADGGIGKVLESLADEYVS